ncbi:MAG TPA: polyprenyl synthetase family protein [Bacteroidales bacterium]|nr:polyprenyl synthetase family protein [Bacteroidales bacterium]
MIKETAISLIVPASSTLRDEIRKKADKFFEKNKVLPPVSYEKLEQLAGNLIASNSWDPENKAFVMVCCGNAIWRSVVGSIPYDRRMLLLPQCLRNSRLCKGSWDELGLFCKGCGNCNISGFLDEAEELGYVTIVSEGTTIATQLIENGNVDAIIGVGCMEVLQKMFSSVNKYSVPAIGVPLLTCGCVDTSADAEWISEEINHFNENSGFRLLNIIHLKEKTNSLFTESHIDELLDLKDSLTNKIVRDTLLAGGKRIRPLLTVLAYEAFSTNPDQEVLKHLAMSVECFHKASLIHDDIEDNDELRYGKETIHNKYGIPVAVNLGDLLIGEGYRLLAGCRLSPEIISRCLKIVSTGHKAMSAGQGTELLARRNVTLLQVEEILEIFHNKTSEAFKVALLAGAIAGEADEISINILIEFSHLIGVAYQIKDDLEDFKMPAEGMSFQIPSLPVSVLNELAGESDRELLMEYVNANNLTAISELIEKYDVKARTGRLIKENLGRIYSCLERLENIRLKLALHEIVGKTFRDYV